MSELLTGVTLTVAVRASYEEAWAGLNSVSIYAGGRVKHNEPRQQLTVGSARLGDAVRLARDEGVHRNGRGGRYEGKSKGYEGELHGEVGWGGWCDGLEWQLKRRVDVKW